MNSQAASYKRNHFLVMPGFQLKFMGYIICFAVFGIMVLYASNYLYYEHLVAEGKELGLAADHIYFEFIEQQKSLLNTTFLSVSAIVFGCLFLAGLYLSHKIAGPVYRIKLHLEYIREHGEAPGKLKFRDRDFFPEVAELVNELVAIYEERRE